MSIEIRECCEEDIQGLKKKFVREHVSGDVKNTTLLGYFIDGKIIGVCGYMFLGNKIRFKTDYVLPEYRGRHIYMQLFIERDRKCKEYRRKCTAFCTEKSIGQYLKYGFRILRKNSSIYFVEREA